MGGGQWVAKVGANFEDWVIFLSIHLSSGNSSVSRKGYIMTTGGRAKQNLYQRWERTGMKCKDAAQETRKEPRPGASGATLGRVVRPMYDKGVAFLLDRRFRQKHVREQLSKSTQARI